MMLQILTGDALERLRELPAESVQCCVTSPPYWGLRDYSAEGQLGLEATPDEYVAKMVAVFREVLRVLRKDGTLWLNLGDSYAGGGNYRGVNADTLTEKQGSNRGSHGLSQRCGIVDLPPGLKAKDLCGIPWRVAFALQADGWWLRSDIIWAKPNPMPESVTDRPTKSHEYLFLLTKSASYYFDQEAIREPQSEWNPENNGGSIGMRGSSWMIQAQGAEHGGGKPAQRNPAGRNKRSVWTIATAPFSGVAYGGTNRKLSKDCPVHGYQAYRARVQQGDERPAAYQSARNLDTENDLFQSPPSGVPAKEPDQFESLFDEVVANARSNRIRRKAELLAQGGIFGDKSAENIECKEQQPRSAAMSGHVPGSKSEEAVSSGEHSQDSVQTGVDKTGKCTCVEYGDLTSEKQDHFAVFPPDLIKPCIMAGTSARGCCAKCGAPWERIVEQRESKQVAPSELDRFGTGDAGVHRKVGGQYQKWLDENPIKTIGWQPTCKCHDAFDLGNVTPCTVLDPFAGSGTTGAVALELGRKAVLIELNPKYVALIEQRCTTTVGLALA